MNKASFIKCLFVNGLLLSSLSNGSVLAEQCEIDNANLQLMPNATVTFTNVNGETFDLVVRIAETNQTRSAGFQRVCELTIKAKPILFLFKQQLTPRFHMNNVVAPIDIAFIDGQGYVESVQAMQPYVLGSLNKPLYGPKRPIVAALEVHKGFYLEHGIDLTTHVSWSY